MNNETNKSTAVNGRDKILKLIAESESVHFEDAIYDGYREDKEIALKSFEKSPINALFWGDSIVEDKELFLAAYRIHKDILTFAISGHHGTELKELLKDLAPENSLSIELYLRVAIQVEKRGVKGEPGFSNQLGMLWKAIEASELCISLGEELANGETTKAVKKEKV